LIGAQIRLSAFLFFLYNHHFLISTESTMATSLTQPRSALAKPLDDPLQKAKRWSVEESYAYCERLARAHYENFPVGSVLLPKPLRRYFYSIYAFARTSDDFADEGYTEGYTEQERLELLDEWRVMLKDAFANRARHPIFVALADTQAKFNLPILLFEDLLSAFRQDVVKHRYETFAELVDYCRRSANPIGRLVLLLFGHREEEKHVQSDAICTGLQLANHWQDVEIDLGKDRLYVPEEDLQRFGLTVDALYEKKVSPKFQNLMKFEVARARDLFKRGKPLCSSVKGRLGIELRVVWLGGSRILDGIEENGYDIFTGRPVIARKDKIQILLKALRKGAFDRS
jgi:phytoene synthase